MAGEVWGELYDRLANLALEHRTTLIFVNTRRLAERVAHHLSERLGADAVMAHHGSLAWEHRREAEGRLKAGMLRALVATASLELDIDIGDIDLVCQLGSPRSVAALLQRVGRSGHALAATPKGRLFPLSRDDLAECTTLLAAARTRRLDRIRIPHQPMDVLAQQIVAEALPRTRTRRGYSSVCVGPGPIENSPAPPSTKSCRCSPMASRPESGAVPPTSIVTGSMAGSAGARVRA